MKKISVNLSLSPPLFLIFLVLKLTGVITWSWWWVTAPLWIPLCVAPIFFVIFLVFILLGLKG